MEKNIEKLKNCMYEIKIKLSPEEVGTYFNSAYTQINKKVQIPGFRKGKAPRDILKKYYEGLAKEKVINSVIPEYYTKTIQENDIQPVSEPTVTDVNFGSDSSFSFKLKVPVKPDIKLNKYKGIKVIKKPIQVSPQEVENVLKQLQEQHAELRPSGSNKVQREDYVICDVICKLDGEIIEDKKNIKLPIRKEFPIPELIQGLEGAKTGEEKIIQAVLPEGIYEDKYVGKKALFYVTIHDIKKKILPELNDNFAKRVGKFDSLESLRGKLRDDIIVYKQRKQKEELQNQLLDKLLKYNKFNVPESLIDKEKQSLIKQTKKNLASRGLSNHQIESDKKKILEGLETQAERRIRTYFLLNHIADKENIRVSEEEIQEEIVKLAKSTHQTPETLKSYLKKEKLSRNLISDIKVKKIIDFLLDNAKVK